MKFIDELENACKNLSFMPFKHRKSLSFDDENIRDLIFKGYVIPFVVRKDSIYILGIYKENLWFDV